MNFLTLVVFDVSNPNLLIYVSTTYSEVKNILIKQLEWTAFLQDLKGICRGATLPIGSAV